MSQDEETEGSVKETGMEIDNHRQDDSCENPAVTTYIDDK